MLLATLWMLTNDTITEPRPPFRSTVMPLQPFIGSVSYKHPGKLRGDIEIVSINPHFYVEETRLVVTCGAAQMGDVTWEYVDGTILPHAPLFQVMDWGNTYVPHAAPVPAAPSPSVCAHTVDESHPHRHGASRPRVPVQSAPEGGRGAPPAASLHDPGPGYADPDFRESVPTMISVEVGT